VLKRVLPLLRPGVKLNPKATVIHSWVLERMLRILSLGLCAYGTSLHTHTHIYIYIYIYIYSIHTHTHTYCIYIYIYITRMSIQGGQENSSPLRKNCPFTATPSALHTAKGSTFGRNPSHARARSFSTPKFDCRPRRGRKDTGKRCRQLVANSFFSARRGKMASGSFLHESLDFFFFSFLLLCFLFLFSKTRHEITT